MLCVPYFLVFGLVILAIVFFWKREKSVVVVEKMVPPPVPSVPRLVPVNVPTNVGYVNAEYRQVGILTPVRGSKNKILPLFGKPLFVNRQKWQYYSMSDQNHSLRLPIRVKGKLANNEYGVDEIYGGDRVFVEGYNDGFVVTMYENNNMGI
jgi:hypothetical protein